MAALALGLVAGGALTGLIVWVTGGLLAWIPATAGPYLVGSVALAIVLRDLDVVRIPLPARERQVPRSILNLDSRRAAAGFGFELGLGFRTYVTASAPYLLIAVLIFVRAPLPLCVACGAAFGLGRLAMAVCRYLSTDGEAWNSLMDSRAGVLRRATALAAALGATALAFMA
jgi:hypothetical protein